MAYAARYLGDGERSVRGVVFPVGELVPVDPGLAAKLRALVGFEVVELIPGAPPVPEPIGPEDETPPPPFVEPASVTKKPKKTKAKSSKPKE